MRYFLIVISGFSKPKIRVFPIVFLFFVNDN